MEIITESDDLVESQYLASKRKRSEDSKSRQSTFNRNLTPEQAVKRKSSERKRSRKNR
jgi:hypothetical protein